MISVLPPQQEKAVIRCKSTCYGLLVKMFETKAGLIALVARHKRKKNVF